MTPRVAGLSETYRLLLRMFTWSPASFFAASLSSFLPPSILHPQTPGWGTRLQTKMPLAFSLSQGRRDGGAGRAEAGLEVSSALHAGGWASRGWASRGVVPGM